MRNVLSSRAVRCRTTMRHRWNAVHNMPIARFSVAAPGRRRHSGMAQRGEIPRKSGQTLRKLFPHRTLFPVRIFRGRIASIALPTTSTSYTDTCHSQVKKKEQEKKRKRKRKKKEKTYVAAPPSHIQTTRPSPSMPRIYPSIFTSTATAGRCGNFDVCHRATGSASILRDLSSAGRFYT